MSIRKYPPISVHKTLNGQLEVDWKLDYYNEYNCSYCEGGKLTKFFHKKCHPCKLILGCNSCQKRTYLTCQILGAGLKYSPISQHQTLGEILKVNWNQAYKGEYGCPICNKGQLNRYYYRPNLMGNLALDCNVCGEYLSLTCHVPVHISNYLSNVECPNPLCTKMGNNGQKGWIYKIKGKSDNCKCHFCKIIFNPNSTNPSSWVGSQTEDKLRLFSFDDDIWDSRHFYDKPSQKFLNFQEVSPDWYRQEVKEYLHYLLKARVFSSVSTIRKKIITFKQLGRVIVLANLKNKSDINRDTIIRFLASCQENNSSTINKKIADLRDFFDWLGLETLYLIRRRDFLKVSKNDTDWLDEVTRKAIKGNLNKIPTPIARHYLVQAYIAARPDDVRQINFECLVEENGKWYVQFFQHKTKRWHRILASREIRIVIEEQQQWIRETFGEDYSYLFCHFRNIRVASYPRFLSMKPLPKIPSARRNPMVLIIRMLIEKENIRDINGQKPHFTGAITRHSRLQEVRTKYGMEAARLYADHQSGTTTFQHYTPPTREQVAKVDLPFQQLLLNPDNKFLPWQSLPESLLKNPKAHELDLEIAPRLVVYGHCALDPKTPCPVNLFPKCYGCSSFRPSTGKLPLYERQYQGEQQRLTEAEKAGAELAHEEAKATIEAMDKWLPELRRLANG